MPALAARDAWGWLRRIMGAGSQGTGFGGRRDYYEAFGWNPRPSLEDYLFKYLYQDIAQRIIEAPVRATWGDPPIVNSDAQFLTAWQNLVSRQRVWHNLMALDKLAGLGQYAAMVIGIDDGRSLETPVSPVRMAGSLRQVTYLQPYLQLSCRVQDYNQDPTSPRFGKPETYWIEPRQSEFSQPLGSQLTAGGVSTGRGYGQASPSQLLRQPFACHWSRLLHVADGVLENDVFGVPRLSPVYNLLDDLLKVVGGSSETYWLTANRGMQADVDKEMELNEEDAKNLEAEIEQFQHDLRRVIKTRGVKITNLGSDLANPSANFTVLISLIAATTGIPQRVLMGSEAGSLASTQDRANWATRISERIADFAEPCILVPFITQLIGMGVLPNPTQMSVTWPDAFKLSPLERGQTSAQMARSTANLTKTLSAPIGGIAVVETEENAEMEDVPGSDAVPPDPNNPDDQGKPATPPSKQPTGKKVTIQRSWMEGGVQMFTVEEARQIVGFGKTMPVFDDKQDSQVAPGGD
jgi:hypothetical protein